MRDITAFFANGVRKTAAYPHLWQWDFGQRLVIRGIALPVRYEIHFCNPGDDTCTVVPGKSDGIDEGVEIPDKYLETGKDILAFVYTHDGYDGYTVYAITIPVKKREYSDSTHMYNKSESEQESSFLFYVFEEETAWMPKAGGLSDTLRSDQESLFDLPALLEEMSWAPSAGSPYHHENCPKVYATGAFIFDEDGPYQFDNSAVARHGSGDRFAAPDGVFYFYPERFEISWASTATTE